MNELVIPGLVSFGTYLGTRLVDNLLERRKAARTATREDRHDALAEVEKLWARIDKMETDYEQEIAKLRKEHAAKIAELTTQIGLAQHRTGAAEKRALLAEQERDKLLAKIAPLETELEQLRQRVKELEKVNSHE